MPMSTTTTTSTTDNNDINALMLIHVLRCFPTATQASLVCAAGTLGYHAFKEMLKCCDGPGEFVLLTNNDLSDIRNAEEDGEEQHILRITDFELDCYELSFYPPKMKNIILLSNAGSVDIELRDLKELESITIDLPFLEELPDSFLSGCSNVHTLNIMSPMPRIGAISENFLLGCKALLSIDMSPFSSVYHFQHSFMIGCSSIESIDMTPLATTNNKNGGDNRLDTLPDVFMSGCTALKSVTIGGASAGCFCIPTGFLEDCTAIEEVIFHPECQVVQIPYTFLGGCIKLKSIDLRPFSRLTGIAFAFLQGCSSLTSLDLSPLTNVEEVEEMFLAGCTGLTVLDLSPLSNISSLPDGFMTGCSGLAVLDLSSFARLEGGVPLPIQEEFKGRIVLPPPMP